MHWNLQIWKKFQAISYHNCLSRILPKIFLVSLLSPRSIHLREAILMKPQYIKTEKNKKIARKNFSVGRGRKLNVHKTFRRRPGRLLNVLYTSVYILYLQGCIYHNNSKTSFVVDNHNPQLPKSFLSKAFPWSGYLTLNIRY